MGRREISLRLMPDGSIQADIRGVKGKKCTDYIKILEEILEAEAIDSSFTSEYYETEVVDEVRHFRTQSSEAG